MVLNIFYFLLAECLAVSIVLLKTEQQTSNSDKTEPEKFFSIPNHLLYFFLDDHQNTTA